MTKKKYSVYPFVYIATLLIAVLSLVGNIVQSSTVNERVSSLESSVAMWREAAHEKQKADYTIMIEDSLRRSKAPALCPVTSDLDSCQVGCLGAVGLKFGFVDASVPGQVDYFKACADFCMNAQEVV